MVNDSIHYAVEVDGNDGFICRMFGFTHSFHKLNNTENNYNIKP